MASIKLNETKDGRRFFQISVSRGYGKAPYKTRWYWPDGWSKRTAEREAAKQAAAFELACKNGEVLNRAQEREKAAQEAAEAAKLKTVRQYADGVFMPTKEATFSENARSSYRMFLDRHIFPVLGDVLLVEVSPAMITKLLVDFQRAGYAHATAVKLYNILNGIFQTAFLDDSIPMNPMLKVKRPAPRKGEQPKEESEKAYTVQELSYILSCAAQEPLQWQTYISLAADTGLRRGECCGLQWSDIDFKNKLIKITKSYSYTEDRIKDPKTESSKRVIRVSQKLLDILKQLRINHQKFIFMSPQGKVPTANAANKVLRKQLKKLGIKKDHFHFHSLRHTHVALLLFKGVPLYAISKRLGHSNMSITADVYAYMLDELRQKSDDQIEEILDSI